MSFKFKKITPAIIPWVAIIFAAIVAVFLLFRFIVISNTILTDKHPDSPINTGINNSSSTLEAATEVVDPGPTLEERVKASYERSKRIKGAYMTSLVASSVRGAGKLKRDNIVKLTEDTELNAIVIDVKEVNGGELNDNLVQFVKELKEKNIWSIARVALMRDSSQTKEHPEWYIQRTDGRPWYDGLGHHWLDPANQNVADYLVNFSKTVIDVGFDEIQVDYIRYPSDGNLRIIAASSSPTNKFTVINSFSEQLVRRLKEHKPEIIVSADVFGYIATLKQASSIGQKLEDMGQYFDYISLMLYPNHFYAGFHVPADPVRDLPALSYGYGVDASYDVVAHPYQVLNRSIITAQDIIATSSGKALMRPYLQDFNLSHDTSRGIFYDASRVRAQIDGAEDAGAEGWLLWNSGNNYSEGALKKNTE
jgi:hypothetical protein